MPIVAMILPDPSAIGGCIVPTSTGFNWRLFAVVRDTVTNHKETLQQYSADTLDADTLIQVRDKLIAATNAQAQLYGFGPLTHALLNHLDLVVL